VAQESGWFATSQFSSGDARRELWAEHSWLKREACVGSADLQLAAALLELWLFFFFLIDAFAGIFMWVSEGEAGGVVGGYRVTLSCCEIRGLLSRQVSVRMANGGRAKASARAVVCADVK